MKKQTGKRIAAAWAAALMATAAQAKDSSLIDSTLNYTTLGVWASAPLGLSARVGLAVPLDKEAAITFGNEFGLNGNKQFISLRVTYAGHGIGWGGIDLAHWKTRSHPLLADAETDYYGLEVQMLLFRAGIMVPSGEHKHPSLTFGIGLSY